MSEPLFKKSCPRVVYCLTCKNCLYGKLCLKWHGWRDVKYIYVFLSVGFKYGHTAI